VLLPRRLHRGFGLVALARKLLFLQLALDFFLMLLCRGLGGCSRGRLALGLGGRCGLFGLTQQLRIFRLDFVALHIGALLAHFDADGLRWRAAAATELELRGLAALERDALRLAGHRGAGLLLQIAQQRHLVFGGDLRISLGRCDARFLELHQQFFDRATQFLRKVLYGYC
jgi:hypothetical protein